ncbi:hypothetical protein LZ32DRAFT_611039 [Colletotrichum eremochloae]|nr:hypothetical protein LZ32DRAFT_611039 [Colletotrichum eremochloae]
MLLLLLLLLIVTQEGAIDQSINQSAICSLDRSWNETPRFQPVCLACTDIPADSLSLSAVPEAEGRNNSATRKRL